MTLRQVYNFTVKSSTRRGLIDETRARIKELDQEDGLPWTIVSFVVSTGDQYHTPDGPVRVTWEADVQAAVLDEINWRA